MKSLNARRGLAAWALISGWSAVLMLSACAPLPTDPSASTAKASEPGLKSTVETPSAPTAPGAPPKVNSGKAKESTGAPKVFLAIDAQTVLDSESQVATVVPPADMWDRIRVGFNMPNLDNPLVHESERWHTLRPDSMSRMAQRSKKYIFYIVEELERRGMPTELALLPFVESAFNPQAVSSAKAAGMWQFMPATGTTYDLHQNLFRDDRRDVLASTRAALDYLQKLHAQFGDWHLALAAYNWGEGNVAKAIAKNQKLGLGTGFEDLSMPNETRHYVPKLQSLKNIVQAPSKFKVELPFIANHPYFDTVELPRDIDVALAARLADITLADFQALNPSASKLVILASGTPQILLPWDNAALFNKNLAAYQSGQLASWTAWIAPSTLSVAAVATRVGMSESELRSVNNIPPHMLVKQGSTLIVRRNGALADQGDVTGHIADTAQLSFSPEFVQKQISVKVGHKDTLTSVAKRYKVNPAQLALWNNLNLSPNAALRNGQVLSVFVSVTGGPTNQEDKKNKQGNQASQKSKGNAPATKRASKKQAAGANNAKKKQTP